MEIFIGVFAGIFGLLVILKTIMVIASDYQKQVNEYEEEQYFITRKDEDYI
tara:strand:+ start:4145 stop:4297 length:153 start_codon:yes stop_codon:yes gene_type:complete